MYLNINTVKYILPRLNKIINDGVFLRVIILFKHRRWKIYFVHNKFSLRYDSNFFTINDMWIADLKIWIPGIMAIVTIGQSLIIQDSFREISTIFCKKSNRYLKKYININSFVSEMFSIYN